MTLQRDGVQRQLQQLLNEEFRLLNDLEQLLQQETEALSGSDLAVMSSVGATRHRCVQELTRLDHERVDTCRMLSFGTGRAAVDRLFDWADSTGQLKTKWQANLEIARRCKALNERNGAIVTAKLGHVQRRLRAVRGTAPPPVYGTKAARYGDLGVRYLGSA